MMISGTKEQTPTWAPLLSPSSEIAARCWDAIHAIAEAVSTRNYGDKISMPHEDALLFGYLARAESDSRWAELALERLNEAIEAAASSTHCALFGGLCGLGWVTDHLASLLSESVANEERLENPNAAGEADNAAIDDVNADIDTLLLRELQRGRWAGHYDLISGLVGFGIYFLQRLPAAKATLGMELLVYHLDKAAERKGDQITWFTAPELLTPRELAQFPAGCHNLGVAHGVPGVLFFLSEALAAGIEPRKTRRLLEGGVEWLIAQERSADAGSRFATYAENPADSRLAWCYGDLGIAAVLSQAGRRCARQDWSDLARGMADACAARPDDRTGVVDAPVCHGYAGIAHIFNRLHQTEKSPQFQEAALKYYRLTLAMRQPHRGVGGFLAVRRASLDSPPNFVADPAFIDGAIGIALALLAATTPQQPCWDRLLLVSGGN